MEKRKAIRKWKWNHFVYDPAVHPISRTLSDCPSFLHWRRAIILPIRSPSPEEAIPRITGEDGGVTEIKQTTTKPRAHLWVHRYSPWWADPVVVFRPHIIQTPQCISIQMVLEMFFGQYHGMSRCSAIEQEIPLLVHDGFHTFCHSGHLVWLYFGSEKTH